MRKSKAIIRFIKISLGHLIVLSFLMYGSFCFAYMFHSINLVQGSTGYKHVFYHLEPEYPNWDPNKRYFPGDVVYYNGAYYFASMRFSTTGEVGLRPDTNCGSYEKWEVKKDISIKDWNPLVIYKQGDVVYFNGEYYQAKFYSTNDLPSSASEINPWHKLVNTWNSEEVYSPFDPSLKTEVIYNGRKYSAMYWNKGTVPDKNYGGDGSGQPWVIIKNIIEVAWQENVLFGPKDIVNYNGEFYMANTYSKGERPDLNHGQDGAWTKLVDTWQMNVNYNKNDIVIYKGVQYKARNSNVGLKPNENYGNYESWEIVYYFP